MGDWIVKIIESVYNFLWGDLIVLPLPGGGELPLSLLVIILIPPGFILRYAQGFFLFVCFRIW